MLKQNPLLSQQKAPPHPRLHPADSTPAEETYTAPVEEAPAEESYTPPAEDPAPVEETYTPPVEEPAPAPEPDPVYEEPHLVEGREGDIGPFGSDYEANMYAREKWAEGYEKEGYWTWWAQYSDGSEAWWLTWY